MSRYRLAALCAGYSGLEMGLELAGVDFDLAWYAETDRHASKVLAHHHPGVPNLGDLTQITETTHVPSPGGGVIPGTSPLTSSRPGSRDMPCQPVSQVGLQLGADDVRWLIDDVVRVWVATGARWLILENVPGLLSMGQGRWFGRVLDALAEVGADAEWTHCRASDVGAPHRRNRWFCIASAPHANGERLARKPSSDGAQGPLEVGARSDADRCRLDRWGDYRAAVERWEQTFGRPAPDPLVIGGAAGGRLNARLPEWMMGLPDGWVTGIPAAQGVLFGEPDTESSRQEHLRMLGNGVCPAQAALAIGRLLGEPEIFRESAHS